MGELIIKMEDKWIGEINRKRDLEEELVKEARERKEK